MSAESSALTSAVFEAFAAVFFFFTSISQKPRCESEVTDKPDVIIEERSEN